ncbi:beta-1,3-galactosyl-O-glycosyl-glycoprotein beta-1,6-N-acetylglucosaminyltransferase-like [Saccoglossus kowalevskii]|uniref:Beta-1,3-galactosyl-O-glycosyl-glycoprotein beta-1,6-N-acetylglucosaminyltransferase 3-like n=1 Tax=Saccoglossus kowalevskii TaxID=10224 RepID=A0ABM0GMP0_SACKO|nr:PREDICTED: beta-1,3-galactosyl-O-glycosyl-glycoprotein beta-1,6-N-acetylglucosaminyltransferase 3-like [Saccoglossus kowalevskii]
MASNDDSLVSVVYLKRKLHNTHDERAPPTKITMFQDCLLRIPHGKCINPKVILLLSVIALGNILLWKYFNHPTLQKIKTYSVTQANVYTNSTTELISEPIQNTTTFHQEFGDENQRIVEAVQCSDLINGKHVDGKTISIKNKILKSRIVPDSAFSKLANNCTEFVRERGYLNKPITGEERDFPLAYGIYIYKSVNQVEQLLRTIYRPHNIYCIHVDRKSPKNIIEAIQNIAKCFDNVFVPRRVARVTWCSIEVVRAELYCQSELLSRNNQWRYYINLSGQEFPLKTNLELVQILKQYDGKNDVFSKLNPTIVRQRYRYVVVKNTMKNTTIKHNPVMPLNSPIYKGELHVALTRKFVEFIHHTDIGRVWFTWLNDTLCPDEHYYQTLNRLSIAPGGDYRLNSSVAAIAVTRSKLWSNKKACNGTIVRDICVFGWKALPKLSKRPELFANKFHDNFDSLVLNCLEEVINNRTNNPVELNLEFYRNISIAKSWNAVSNADWRGRGNKVF